MKYRAAIQFRGDKNAFVDAWNASAATKIELGIIVLDIDSPEYRALREMYNRFAAAQRMVWAERILVDYEAEELRGYELLEFNINRNAGPGGNTYGAAYAESIICNVCGRRSSRQVSDLTVQLEDFLDSDLEDGDQFADLHITANAEIIASDRVRSLMEQEQSKSYSFRGLRYTGELLAAPRYWHLIVQSTIGPALDPSPIERGTICTGCAQPRETLVTLLPGARGSEFYFSRTSMRGELIFRTTDEFGRGPSYQPIYFISQKLYRLLMGERIKGFRVQPAHLVE